MSQEVLSSQRHIRKMEKRLKDLVKTYQAQIEDTAAKDGLERLRIAVFGKNGAFTNLSKDIGTVKKEDRAKIGKLINEVKQQLQESIDKKSTTYNRQSTTYVDLTAPSKQPQVGHLHPITQAIWDITKIFERIGFEVTDTREIDTDWYAFGALNFPENHPARDEWETFFIDQKNIHLDSKDKVVLTPHTSNAQVRIMEQQKPPIRNITISKCYRRQADVSHLSMFHQFEGIFVDKNASITNLKGVLTYFFSQYYGPDRKYRIRPYDFRFTEPSFEVDITCYNCNGKGCRVCKQGWLELGGAGMIHPNVLKNGGIDNAEYSGFAFGWGVERVRMMKGDIQLSDIRQLYTNDLRFIEQF